MMVEQMKKKDFMMDKVKELPEGRAWLEIQIGGKDDDDAAHNAQKIVDAFQHHPHVTSDIILKDKQAAHDLWDIRKAGLPVTTWVPGQKRDTWEGWEDSAVPRDKLGEYVRKLKALMHKHDYHAAMYGHFGDGLIHMRLGFRFAYGLGSEKLSRLLWKKPRSFGDIARRFAVGRAW